MKPSSLLLLALLLQACSKLGSPSEATDCNLPSPTTDSAQLDDFKQHMGIREVLHPFIPVADTMYCFRGRGGWGGFDYLCSVYNDTIGYKAAFTQMMNPHLTNEITFTEQVTPIGALVWKQIQTDFAAQDFWCNPFTPDNQFCIDCNNYYVWARQGKGFRLVKWDNAETKLDSLKMLGKSLWDICSSAIPTGTIQYSIKQDSIYASIYSNNYASCIFIKDTDTEMYYDGALLPQKDGIGKLVLPKQDINKLKKAEIIEYGIDGSVHRFRVSKLSEEKY